MGNYKFRLSDMIPNAWFYKLKDMSRSRSRRNPHHPNKKKQSSTSSCSASNNYNIFSQKPTVGVSSQRHRQSFYYTWESFTPRPADQNSPTDVYFPADPPRRSSKRRSRSRTRRKTVYKPSPRRVTAALHDDDDDEEEEEEEDCSRSCQGQAEAEAEAASLASNSLQKNYFDSPSTDASLEFFDLLKYADAPNGAGVGGAESRSSTCSCGFSSSAATTDIIIDVNEKCFNARNFDHSSKLLFDDAAFDRIPELDLPPILTKPTKLDPNEEAAAAAAASALALGNLSSIPLPPVKTVKPGKETASPTPSGLRGIKLRANSPKVATRKNQGQGVQGRSRKSTSKSQKKVFSESFAVVKASVDPQKDFRDSMMEMIVENNIRASKDLEDLLACYLSLNSDEYHHLIIHAFEQIWFNIPHPKF